MKEKKKSSIDYLVSFIADYKGSMILAVFFAVLGSASGIVPYFAVSAMIVEIFNGVFAIEMFAQYSLIALLGHVGKVWLSSISTIISHRSAFGVLKNIRTAMTAKLAKVPMGYILDTPSGKFKTLMVDTVEKIELPIAHMIPEVTAGLLIPLGMLSYMFYLDWRIALISLATIPVGFFCYMGMTKDYEKRYNKLLAAEKNMSASIVEYISGIEVIKAFNQSVSSYKKYTDAVKENENARKEWFRLTNSYYIAGITIMPASLLGVLPLGAYLFMTGSLTGSSLVTLVILSLGLIKPLLSILEYTDSVAMVDTTVKAVGALLDTQELSRPADKVSLSSTTIALENVCFGYGETEILHGLSFSAVNNGMTAIVGPSGGGKSTIAKLIASFWEAKSGAVLLGGVDVRTMPLSQVMDNVAYVSQDNFLFNLSIKENIAMGKKDATTEQIIEAAKKASCHDFIDKLPNKYDTSVGDAGGKLSGGERQRIALARAILKNAPVVVLDEATAFTDPENEANIQRSIAEIIKNKTVIIIAHRLSTIMDADKIVVVEKGKIVGQGTHPELLEKSHLYKSMWQAHIRTKDEDKEGSQS